MFISFKEPIDGVIRSHFMVFHDNTASNQIYYLRTMKRNDFGGTLERNGLSQMDVSHPEDQSGAWDIITGHSLFHAQRNFNIQL